MYVNKKIIDKINIFKKSNKRYLILPLLLSHKSGLHANILFFDNKTKKLERFDPNGSQAVARLEFPIDNCCKEFGMHTKLISEPERYISPRNLCSKKIMNPQRRQKASNKFHDSCATWCMWYIHLRLINPDISREDVLEYALENFLNKINSNDVIYENMSYNNFIEDYNNKFEYFRYMVTENPNMSLNKILKN